MAREEVARCANCKRRFTTTSGARRRTCPRCLGCQRELQAANTAIALALAMPPPPRLPRVFRVLEGD